MFSDKDSVLGKESLLKTIDHNTTVFNIAPISIPGGTYAVIVYFYKNTGTFISMNTLQRTDWTISDPGVYMTKTKYIVVSNNHKNIVNTLKSLIRQELDHRSSWKFFKNNFHIIEANFNHKKKHAWNKAIRFSN